MRRAISKTITTPAMLIAVCITCILIIVAAVIVKAHFTDQKPRVILTPSAKNDHEVITLISRAQSYVYFSAGRFTSGEIADELIKAQKRGVTVWGVTTKSQAPEQAEIIQKLTDAGVGLEFRSDLNQTVIVTDKAYAVGEYNWTVPVSDKTDQTLEVGTNGQLHDKYYVNLLNLLRDTELSR